MRLLGLLAVARTGAQLNQPVCAPLHRMRAWLAGPVGLLLCTGPVLLALQGPPPPSRAGVDLIRVDVSVLDPDRQPDLTIRENGRVHEIAAFAEIDLPEPEPPPAAWMRDVARDTVRNENLSEHRLAVIELDDAMVPFDAQMIASVKSLGHSLVDRLGPRELAAIVATRDTGGCKQG